MAICYSSHRRLICQVTHLQGDLFSERGVGVGKGAGHPNAHGNACGIEEGPPLRLIRSGPDLLGTVNDVKKTHPWSPWSLTTEERGDLISGGFGMPCKSLGPMNCSEYRPLT